MDIISEPKTQTVEDWTFYFLNGQSSTITLYQDRGDSSTLTAVREILFTCKDEKGNVVERICVSPLQVLYYTKKERKIPVLPEGETPVSAALKRLADEDKAAAQARIAALASKV